MVQPSESGKAVTVHRLNGGLKAVFVPCEAESIAFGLFVASGSRHEPARLGGISHFIEHMLFKGTENRSPVEISQAIEGRGGNFNAWTTEESTVYYVHMPYEYLSEAVDVIADMYLHPLFSADEFERERAVIIEEIRMYADEPDSVAADNLQRALFPKSRLGSPVAGSEETLRRMTPEMLRDYVRTHYCADRTVAVIAGRFDPDEALSALEDRLGGAAFADRRGRAPRLDHPRDGDPIGEVVVKRDVQQVQLALGYRTFGISDPHVYAASVFDAIMGRGMSSRLFQEVREKRALSYDITSRLQLFQNAGIWAVTAGTDPTRAGRMLETIDRELKRIASRRVPEDELRRTKEFLIGNFRLAHEKVTSRLFYYGSVMLSFGRPVPPAEQISGISKVTAKEVRAVAEEILSSDERSVSWVRKV